MKKIANGYSKPMIACLAMLVATSAIASAEPKLRPEKGMAVAYPWVFAKGDRTSRKFAERTAEEIARKAGYATIGEEAARAAWRSAHLPRPSLGHMPSTTELEAYGKALHASAVLFGSASWNTRSIWVDLGPKTISTATVNAYVFDVATGKVSYRAKQVQGRSDERENDVKIVADVLITPLVTAVSGGPATPREQRAVQIALGRAYRPWVR